MVSTVVSTKGSSVSHWLSSQALCIELGVLFTINFRGTCFASAISFRCAATAVICSLQITHISLAPLAINTRIKRSIRCSPPTSTRGFGACTPSCANRDPSPAAIIAYFILNRLKLLVFGGKGKHFYRITKTLAIYLGFIYYKTIKKGGVLTSHLEIIGIDVA